MILSVGNYQSDMDSAFSKILRDRTIERIWRKDHTVWKQEPNEIANRLGWLDVMDFMRSELPEIQLFTQQIRNDGFQYIVLLGMGGSSLGPEVLRSVFGKQDGFPELIVLDSIDPDWILKVQDQIDMKHTLFLVSSKSGSTIEPNLLYDYFRSQVEFTVGKDAAGDHFVAVTDMGSPLAYMAAKQGFRKIFENPADIGGRYSVLSFFGLVPGALTGIDMAGLLDEAQQMKQSCTSNLPQDNPGCLLGVIMGVMALQGRDKLTLITSPGVSRFGLWAEQLIAESTGKEDHGIVPVVGEPLVDPQYYGNDRMFVYLRLDGDSNESLDATVASLRDSGQPLITIQMIDRMSLGAEFYRWEFAVAIASALIGINPFDQPDVQRSKDATLRLLQIHSETGNFPQAESCHLLNELLSRVEDGKYISIMAYIVESPETEQYISQLRRKYIEKYSIATTFGYGPRYLHSTGQLHKGGPNTNLTIQLTVDHDRDLPVPGKPYTFGQLTNAQAMGDLEVLRKSGRYAVGFHVTEGDSVAFAILVHQV